MTYEVKYEAPPKPVGVVTMTMDVDAFKGIYLMLGKSNERNRKRVFGLTDDENNAVSDLFSKMFKIADTKRDLKVGSVTPDLPLYNLVCEHDTNKCHYCNR